MSFDPLYLSDLQPKAAVSEHMARVPLSGNGYLEINGRFNYFCLDSIDLQLLTEINEAMQRHLDTKPITELTAAVFDELRNELRETEREAQEEDEEIKEPEPGDHAQ